MLYGRQRRGSATGIAVIMILITVVASAVSWAIVFGHGGSFPGLTSPTSSGALSSGLSNSSISSFSSAVGGISGLLFNSTKTTENATVALGGRVAVSGSSLPAADFSVNGTSTTFSCSSSPSAAYMALTDGATGTVSVVSIAIASAGNDTMFTPSGPCTVDASGTTYITFSAASELAPSPLSGAYYAGVVGLSDDTQAPFVGVWQ